MIGDGCLCNRIETGAGRAGIPNPRQPLDGHRSWSAQICACRAPPTVSSLTQQYLNRARRRCLPHARDPSKQAFSETVSAFRIAVPLPRLTPGFSGIFPAQARPDFPPWNFHISASHCISMKNMFILNEYSTKKKSMPHEPAPP
ncbi:hypothetical protein FJ414_27170 [Mesorhizobium sp. B3-1-6]|uniref:hypothetical protein n=1 Tax=Mesorhizobium sp. B3-1-6 TaxID=2589895 RepID=UPI00112C309A|nr:hypothetical protein [Mesorhizobium sp. B3-1-6]TPI28565.1 hypothetical protein FJ414_27170 [Mesorhizobium sp. B3-1-6]